MRLARIATRIVVVPLACALAALALPGGAHVTAASAAAVTVTAASCPPAAGPSPWSVSPSYGSSWNPAGWAPQIAGIGVANVRGFRDDSPTRSAIGASGMTSTGILQWSPPGGEFRLPADDLDGWAAYVRDAVTKHPEVRQWEVWNEPPNFTADSRPVSYAAVVRTAYDTAKAVDPGVQIGIGAKATFIAWLAEAIEAGAARHFDYVALHPYERAGKIWDGWEEPFLAIVPQVRAMLRQTSPAQAGVPVQFTEVGSPAGIRAGQAANAHYTPADQAVLLTKVMTLSLAQGVQRVSWYDPFDGDYPAGEAPYGLIALDGQRRPAFTAYGNLVSALGSRPSFAGAIKPDPATYVFVFGCADRVALVAWTDRPGTRLGFVAPATARTVTSNRLTRATRVSLTTAPQIIEVPGAADRRAWLARAATSQRQRSVPRTGAGWSAASGSTGLFVLGGTRTATVAGRPAYRPTDSGLQIAVDGRFAPWRRGPMQVTAVVRRLSGTPGFNIKYDAAGPLSALDWAGQRGTGSWQNVNGTDWQTLTWTLDDARFSGLYGFNVRLDSDSPQYAGYAVASLSIRPLGNNGTSPSSATTR